MNKLVTGFTLGLIVGILYAPDKGSHTRQKISDKSTGLKNQFADLIDNLASKFENSGDEEEHAGTKAEGLKAETV